MITEDQIKEALRGVKYPGFSRDIVSFGIVKDISAKDGAVSIAVQVGNATPEGVQQLKADCERVLKALPGVTHVHVGIQQAAGAQAAAGKSAFQNQNKIPGIKRIVAVAS